VAISASTLKHEQEEYLQAGFDDFIGKPFRFERVCECLAKLLEVEFETDEADEGEEQLLETPQVTLPEELLTQLKAAAKGYRVTELKEPLNEIERLGLAGQKLAKRLSELIFRYDMDTVLKILSEIKPE
jgi:CheY-like chemotaxis protein